MVKQELILAESREECYGFQLIFCGSWLNLIIAFKIIWIRQVKPCVKLPQDIRTRENVGQKNSEGLAIKTNFNRIKINNYETIKHDSLILS